MSKDNSSQRVFHPSLKRIPQESVKINAILSVKPLALVLKIDTYNTFGLGD